VHLFADDVKLYLKIMNVIDIDQLQGALNDLVQCRADLWQLNYWRLSVFYTLPFLFFTCSFELSNFYLCPGTN